MYSEVILQGIVSIHNKPPSGECPWIRMLLFERERVEMLLNWSNQLRTNILIFSDHQLDGLKTWKKANILQLEMKKALGLYDKPLPCFGCGIGWFSFLLGFLCPLIWYYATMLYLGRSYYRKDPRERSGLAASAIAALAWSVILFIAVIILVF